jgi:hypothetical protein
LGEWTRGAALLLAMLAVGSAAGGQAATGQAATGQDRTSDTETTDALPGGVIPVVKGFNFSLVTASQHDSSNGWSSVLTPDAAWRFSPRFSFDANVPVFPYINVDANTGTKILPVYKYETKHFVLGDATLNGHYESHHEVLDYSATVTLGLPTGDDAFGLGAGQVTYAVNNHIERGLAIFTPDIEVGIGDSSSAFGARARKSYVAVGTLAYFQAGTSVDLPLKMNFDAEAYEELPVASTTIYSTTGKGKKKVTTATSEGAAEDNGFNTSLDIPLVQHVVLSGFYSRSLRNKIDTAGFSLTFLLRVPKTE